LGGPVARPFWFGPKRFVPVMHMNPAARVEKLIAPALGEMGYDLVRVRLLGGNPPRLQIMAERHDEAGMTVEDCAEISHVLSALLDAEDPIDESYLLEVSSPGIDRPLTRLRDFERFSGYEAKVELRRPLDGRRRFRGRLLGVEREAVLLRMEGQSVVLPFAEIGDAKLVLTDDLLAESTRGGRSREGTGTRHGHR
jgi:ribosome maturation factor RimP